MRIIIKNKSKQIKIILKIFKINNPKFSKIFLDKSTLIWYTIYSEDKTLKIKL